MIQPPFVAMSNRAATIMVVRRLKPVVIRIPGTTWLERARKVRDPRSTIVSL